MSRKLLMDTVTSFSLISTSPERSVNLFSPSGQTAVCVGGKDEEFRPELFNSLRQASYDEGALMLASALTLLSMIISNLVIEASRAAAFSAARQVSER